MRLRCSPTRLDTPAQQDLGFLGFLELDSPIFCGHGSCQLLVGRIHTPIGFFNCTDISSVIYKKDKYQLFFIQLYAENMSAYYICAYQDFVYFSQQPIVESTLRLSSLNSEAIDHRVTIHQHFVYIYIYKLWTYPKTSTSLDNYSIATHGDMGIHQFKTHHIYIYHSIYIYIFHSIYIYIYISFYIYIYIYISFYI